MPGVANAAFPGANGKILFDDGQGDIYTINPDWTGLTNLTGADPAHNSLGAWSADGRKIAFTRDVATGDGVWDIYVMNADGGGQTLLTALSGANYDPAWSPDGSRIAFVSTRSVPGIGIYVMNADGSNQTRIGNGAQPDWSPDGTKIAFFDRSSFGGNGTAIHTMNPDGSAVTQITDPLHDGCVPSIDSSHFSPDWSPDGQEIAYVRYDPYDECQEGEIYELRRVDLDNPPGPGAGTLVDYAGEYLETPVWSPDGRQFVYIEYVFEYERRLHIGNLFSGGPYPPASPYGDYRSPDWQPLRPPGYARPTSATPASVTLVPAFRPCSSANGSHGPPLTAASCNPPQQASDHLTVGTGDSNGAATNSTGSVSFRVFCHPPDQNGLPECPAPGDQIDVGLTASLRDVRNKAGLSDYAGELRVTVDARVTDRLNGAGGVHPATVSDTPLGFNLTCTPTAAETIGSTCSAATSADAVMPGIALENKRAIWELGQVQVYDGGADGDADTAGDNTLFAVQGLFAQ